MSEIKEKKSKFGKAKAILIGRVGYIDTFTFPLKEGQTEPDQKTTISLYVDDAVTDKSNCFKVILRNGMAKALAPYISVGRKIYVEATIVPRSYEDQVEVSLKGKVGDKTYRFTGPTSVTKYINEYYVSEFMFLDNNPGTLANTDKDNVNVTVTEDTEDNNTQVSSDNSNSDDDTEW